MQTTVRALQHEIFYYRSPTLAPRQNMIDMEDRALADLTQQAIPARTRIANKNASPQRTRNR